LDMVPRTGLGVDVHPFESGRVLHLGGHSDGDAAAHAACDALFSAAGLGDLGENFGTSRPEWAGASGVALLAEAFRLIGKAGFSVGNVSIMIIGNRPRFAARRAEIYKTNMSG